MNIHSNLKFFKKDMLDVLDLFSSNSIIFEYNPEVNKYQIILHNPINKRKQYFTVNEFEVFNETKFLIPINKINFKYDISSQKYSYIVLCLSENTYSISSMEI